MSSSNSLQEYLGPSEEADAEFAKELAKLVTDTSAESRKVDKKTALALWDSAVIPPTSRKKRIDEKDDDFESNEANGTSTMAFTVITKKGNKQQVCTMASSLFYTYFFSLDATNIRSRSLGIGSPHSLSPDERQGRTTAFKTFGFGLRTERRG